MLAPLNPHARMKLAALRAIADKVQSIHGQVERLATTRDPRQAEMLTPPLKRAFRRLKLEFLGAGLDSLAQLAGSMEVAAGRGGSQRQKLRILREGVGSMRSQIEHEQRTIRSEEQAKQREAEREAERDPND
jgi:hypothetical protein